MKFVLFCAAMLSATITPALANPVTPAPATPASATPASATPAPATAAAATLNGDSPIEEISATAAGKAALIKHVPGVLEHAAFDQFKGMSLRALAPLSGGIITDPKIEALEAELKAAK